MDDRTGVADMVLLDPLTEDMLLENLRLRFNEGKIYTYIGDVIVSVNPYEKLPIYTKEVVEAYRSRNIFEMPPHVYSLADDAYRSMRDFNLDQCIIISGESGSGKTEASKVVMRYVAAVSGKGSEVDRVKEQLLQSNPVLEAFGNAKTIRNDNSSRFGKYMDLEFDFKGDPIGGVISNYLLEKSRVVFQAKGERNFHIFYQLLQGADDNYLGKLYLERDFQSYEYVSKSGCVEVPTISDDKDFKVVESAMKRIGFSEQEINDVFKVVASVLHLGNVTFQETVQNGMETVNIDHVKDVEYTSKLLGCTPESLINALSKRTVESGNDKITTMLSPANANFGRDALCKAMYNKLFNWIVGRINDNITAPQKSYGKKVIGVLDIYGFEVFESNSFEQFIINYCNEKLQQLFIELTLKSEQEEYVREPCQDVLQSLIPEEPEEPSGIKNYKTLIFVRYCFWAMGIEWIHIDYFNNSVICDLIEKSNIGIIALLDEECLRPGDVTDITFLEKLNDRCFDHAHFDSRFKTRSNTKLGFESFKLKHYAGDVTYNVKSFIEKNNDLLFRDMSKAMFACDHPILKEMFPEGDPLVKNLKRPPTIGTQMKVSISELTKNLLTKRPHYIRCIKPNEFKQGRRFNDVLVRHQTRYLGLLENIRVRRAGYCYRQPYAVVLERYKMLSTKTWPNWYSRPADGVKEILDVFAIESPECAFGNKKLFIRDPRTVFFLEDQRSLKLIDLVVLLQKRIRGWVAKHKYQKMRQSQIKIASVYRGYKDRQKFLTIRSAAITVQSYIRGFKARAIYSKQLRKYAAPKIARFVRRCLAVQFLRNLSRSLPSLSPLDAKWPECSNLFKEASMQLKDIYHAWRCMKYRKSMTDERHTMLTEKLMASTIFRQKKSSYPSSVSVPFIGDHINLKSIPAWEKSQQKIGQTDVLFAAFVTKVHRRNAKEVRKALLLSQSELLILNPKSLNLLYRISLKNVTKMTTSPYKDGVILFHIREDKGDKALKKGDFMFNCEELIELVTRVSIANETHFHTAIPVEIQTTFTAQYGRSPVEMVMQPDRDSNRASFRKKGTKVNIEV